MPQLDIFEKSYDLLVASWSTQHPLRLPEWITLMGLTLYDEQGREIGTPDSLENIALHKDSLTLLMSVAVHIQSQPAYLNETDQEKRVQMIQRASQLASMIYREDLFA